jgi:hypothetical protein
VNRRLPTYVNASEIPANGAALPSLADVLNYPGSGTLVLESLGFDGGFITAFDPIGNSIYHGGSVDVQRRAAKGLYFRGGYTWSKVIDDSTNELFSSRVNPRRAEDFFDIQNERGNSALNRTHHFTLAWTYELPKFSGNNAFMSKVLGGWQINGIYLAESGQQITPQSGRDINNNFDSAGDRVFVNSSGNAALGSDTDYVRSDPVTGATSITAANPGAANEAFARAHFPRAALTIHRDNATVFLEIVAGRADVMVTDGLEADHQAALHPELCAVAVAPWTRLEKAYMFGRDSAMKAFVDAWLAAALASGGWQRALDRAMSSHRPH